MLDSIYLVDLTIPLTITFAALIIITIALVMLFGKLRKPLFARISVIIGLILACTAFGCLVATENIIGDAEAHGSYGLGEMTVTEVIDHNNASPIDQSAQLPDELRSCIVYFYRYTCPDCEEVHTDIEQWLAEQSNAYELPFYNVSTRSERGKTLKETVNLTEVPSVAVFDADGNFTLQIIYRNENGTAVLNNTALDTLKEAMSHAR